MDLGSLLQQLPPFPSEVASASHSNLPELSMTPAPSHRNAAPTGLATRYASCTQLLGLEMYDCPGPAAGRLVAAADFLLPCHALLAHSSPSAGPRLHAAGRCVELQVASWPDL